MKTLKRKSLWGAGIIGALVVVVLHLQFVAHAAPGNSQSANKVQICHFSPGNPANVQLITINANTLNAHLAHGDMTDLAACREQCGQLKCDDGNRCTIDDCDANNECPAVADRPLINCNDSNGCTADSCDPGAGCVNTPLVGAACDDARVCTGPDTCNAAAECVGAPIEGCCTPETAAEVCDDNDLCTDDLCSDNRCENPWTAAALACDDGDACTIDNCNPLTGSCEHPEIVCDDGYACTEDGLCAPTGLVFNPATDIVVAWSAQSVTVRLNNTDATGFYLGLAETAAGNAGWYGEDCLDNDCHQATGTVLTLSSVNTVDDVTPGDTTLFDDDGDGQSDAFTSGDEDRLTYLLQIIGGTTPGDNRCYVWGDDVNYYVSADPNCIAITQ